MSQVTVWALAIGDAPDLRAIGGRALREMTRLGASPYSMWRDIAQRYLGREAEAFDETGRGFGGGHS